MIRLFEQFNNEQEIHEICRKYEIENYTINPDGSIDVDDDVVLSGKGLKSIPLKFNKVSGFFTCYGNQLSNLEGCPKEVGDSFNCYNNKLTTLIGGPKEVGRHFYCNVNQLTSLEGSPDIVNNFDCSENKLTSLIGSPSRVNGYFKCVDNRIKSLFGAPIIIEKLFDIDSNPISIIDSSVVILGNIAIGYTNINNYFKYMPIERLKIVFEHGIDYDIFKKDGTINHSRLERMFKDFNI